MPAGEFEWDDGVGLVIAFLAGILFLIALKGYFRTRTTRVLLFASAFGVWFATGLVTVAEIVWVGDRPIIDALELLGEATVLVLFFLGMVKA